MISRARRAVAVAIPARGRPRADLAAFALAALAVLAVAGAASAAPWSRPEAESPDGPEHERVYLTESEAVAEVFGEGTDSVAVETWTPADEERRALEKRLGWRVEEPSFRIFHGYSGGSRTGWAVVTEEVGLYRPITFIVKVDPRGEVGAVRVMVYRESRGDEVRRVRFLRQYEGKDLASPIRINRDIVAVTGATLSTRAINAGVRRVLHIVDMHCRPRASGVDATRAGGADAEGTL